MLSIRTLALVCSAAILFTACSALRPPDEPELTDPNHPINSQTREETMRQAEEAHDAAMKAAGDFDRQSTETAPPATTTSPQ